MAGTTSGCGDYVQSLSSFVQLIWKSITRCTSLMSHLKLVTMTMVTSPIGLCKYHNVYLVWGEGIHCGSYAIGESTLGPVKEDT